MTIWNLIFIYKSKFIYVFIKFKIAVEEVGFVEVELSYKYINKISPVICIVDRKNQKVRLIFAWYNNCLYIYIYLFDSAYNTSDIHNNLKVFSGEPFSSDKWYRELINEPFVYQYTDQPFRDNNRRSKSLKYNTLHNDQNMIKYKHCVFKEHSEIIDFYIFLFKKFINFLTFPI